MTSYDRYRRAVIAELERGSFVDGVRRFTDHTGALQLVDRYCHDLSTYHLSSTHPLIAAGLLIEREARALALRARLEADRTARRAAARAELEALALDDADRRDARRERRTVAR